MSPVRDDAVPVDGHDAVAAAMRAVDRRGFLPRAQRASAAFDQPLPIGHGQTCSQPSTVAAMLRMLRVPRGAAVLDVGAGSGWTTALLAHLVGPEGEVLGVERIADIAAWGAANVARAGMPWARLVPAAPGVLGSPRPGGWSRVLVSASARSLPQELVDQVAPRGRMVIPVGHLMIVLDRDADGTVRTTQEGTYSFVPLVED
ncbi:MULTISPECIES: protein-L-isoaspartate O-methyltransferase [Isoptericola]|uniref:Protein-L-isoaspartate O-methyltransferase n=1 Tax=Isoptericola sediminis TaxID=2733572 RepID=A0A849K5I6_9MICO|nr:MULTISPECIES: protein-L-isoaspartate carboxylmethyltransferase [Isoptericola]MDO8149062.1 protein-L-isoaspartate carboxylmethyltransferase [Isoptericola sp. b515]MDO8150998.1 protein-L-isoaspartate carboxylmethyltransferase [Isoptericola sp. b408]NNU27680.1 protein-L-isoaspartate carboxylmethyltransferase [Isoptericola sediminis]